MNDRKSSTKLPSDSVNLAQADYKISKKTLKKRNASLQARTILVKT